MKTTQKRSDNERKIQQPFMWQSLGNSNTFGFQIGDLGVLVRAGVENPLAARTSATPSLCFIPGAALEEMEPGVYTLVPYISTLTQTCSGESSSLL